MTSDDDKPDAPPDAPIAAQPATAGKPTAAEPTVKQLLDRGRGANLDDIVDATTRAELEKWFGLPSFTALEESGAPLPTDDPDIAKVAETRARALESIDPVFLERLYARADRNSNMIRENEGVTLRADPSIALFDHGMLERQMLIADPREVEIPEALSDDLRACTPQALLRDLHRPEIDFEKTFDIVDPIADQRIDAVHEVDKAMKTSWKLPELEASPVIESRELIKELRALRRMPWTDIPMPNRTVTE